MTINTDPSTDIRELLLNPQDGVVGIVDRLLDRSRNHSLRLTWSENGLQMQVDGGGWQPAAEIRKSAFRAMIARIATLCRESPYGGASELQVNGDPTVVFEVTWANTPDLQQLGLTSKITD